MDSMSNSTDTDTVLENNVNDLLILQKVKSFIGKNKSR